MAIGYKVMRVDGDKLVSGADSRNRFPLKRGSIMRMPGDGVYLTPHKQYALDHYRVHDVEALLTLEYDPATIIAGSLEDREPEVSVPEVKIVDYEMFYDDEEWFDDFEAAQKKEEAAKASFAKAVKLAMRTDGAYKAPSQYEHAKGELIIHKSTRPGVAYQVTQIDKDGPSGHMDAADLDAAIRYAWEDLSRAEKRKHEDDPARNPSTRAVQRKDWDHRRKALIKEHRLDKLNASFSPDDRHLSVDLISVPKELQGAGHAAMAMKEILAWADANGITVTLSPTSEFGASKKKLEKWYRSLGFVPNKGRNKDFRFADAMIRIPRARSGNPSSREVRKALRDAGCTELRQKGSHVQIQCPPEGLQTTVPAHGSKDIAKGTLRSIERSVGIDVDGDGRPVGSRTRRLANKLSNP